MPQLWIVAGPNGAGKTTLVSQKLMHRIEVVNPDAIAQTMHRIEGRLNQRGAGEAAIGRRNQLLAAGTDFAIETTLTGSSTLRLMAAAKDRGYKVTLVYVGLATVDLSIRRVLDRVLQGGHAVPVQALERRFPDSMSNLSEAMAIADRSYVLDNSESQRRLLLIVDGGRTKFTAPSLPEWASQAETYPRTLR